MKTNMTRLLVTCTIFRLYPTFKEWKLNKAVFIEWTHQVYILPLRNENRDNRDGLQSPLAVYILPLRNENYSSLLSIPSLESRLYPTFKEWKRKNIDYFVRRTIVYILPLRNENSSGFLEYATCQSYTFISYL